jgi:hypothetical protein
MARPLKVLHLDSPDLRSILRLLIHKGIICRLPLEGNYYLDEKKLLQHRMNRVKWGFILLFLILGIIFLILPKLK